MILVNFVLPKEAEVLIGQDGAERILVDGHECEVVTCAFTRRCWLLNSANNIRIGIEHHAQKPKREMNLIQFPLNNANKAV